MNFVNIRARVYQHVGSTYGNSKNAKRGARYRDV